MFAPLYIALLHHPVLNKYGEIVITSVTNFDIHDLARTSRTYGVIQCFLVTPHQAQQKMVHYIKDYWQKGFGSTFNPDRKEAFENISLSSNLAETRLTIEKAHGRPPHLIATTAKNVKNSLSFNTLRISLSQAVMPHLLVFGTGWGLAPEVFGQVDGVLEPIKGINGYNHLPVRSAVAIVLDRLMGK